MQKDQFQAERELAAERWAEESRVASARQAALLAEKDALAEEASRVNT